MKHKHFIMDSEGELNKVTPALYETLSITNAIQSSELEVNVAPTHGFIRFVFDDVVMEEPMKGEIIQCATQILMRHYSISARTAESLFKIAADLYTSEFGRVFFGRVRL